MTPYSAIDFDDFHTTELPRRLASGNGHLAAADLRTAKPLAFRLTDGRAYTYLPHADGFRIEAGDADAASIVELEHADWCDFVWELRSSFALLYADCLSFPRGHFGHLARWEPALRAAFDGQRIYDLDTPPPVLDAAGAPLDLTQSFTLDDSNSTIRDFLDRAGFVHLRGVLETAEVETLGRDIEDAVQHSRPDDGRSWWTTVDGHEVCNRVNYLNNRSATIARLGADARFLRIGALSGHPLRDCADRLDGHGAVIKVPGAETGLSDLPWHRDCGMGGHPVKCPMLNVGIQIDAARAGSGQLQMIAGSHLGTSRLPSTDDHAHLPIVALDTEPGDVTVHYGHTLHAAPPPTDRAAIGRRALYLTYVPQQVFDVVPAGKGYNDVLFTREAGRIPHVDEMR